MLIKWIRRNKRDVTLTLIVIKHPDQEYVINSDFFRTRFRRQDVNIPRNECGNLVYKVIDSFITLKESAVAGYGVDDQLITKVPVKGFSRPIDIRLVIIHLRASDVVTPDGHESQCELLKQRPDLIALIGGMVRRARPIRETKVA